MVSTADVYAEHASSLVRFATVLVGRDDAQDVVSAAVLRALDVDWGLVTNRRAYLFKAVANEAKNLHRRESRRRQRESRVLTDTVAHVPEAYPEVRAAVERLSVRQRAVVYLAYWEDMTDQMIGDHLGVTAGSVRRHLGRARHHLRRVLDEH